MAFYLAHSNSDSAVLPRSETPKSFIPAQATARVTTFSFPLFILSGAPPGRLLKPVDCISAAPGASESHTWKIASPGGFSGEPHPLSSYPVAGRGRSLPETLFRVKRIFEIFCAVFFSPCPKHRIFVRVTTKKIFFNPGTEVPCSENWNPARKKPPQP